MQSKRTGKIITKVSKFKSKVTILFGKEKLSLSYDTFSSFYLYEGKEITTDELKKIKEFEKMNEALCEAKKLLSKSQYTERKLIEKLEKKGINYFEAKKVTTFLKEHDIINDKAYLEDMLCYYEEKCYGENKIKDDLYKRGIEEKDIQKLHFNENRELKKAKKIIELSERKYQNKNNEKRKESFYRMLICRGFSPNIAAKAIENVKINDSKKEEILLTKDFEKAIRLYQNKYDGKELFDHIYKSLRMKGYSYTNVRKKMEEYIYEND